MKRPLKRRAGKKKLAKTSEAPAHDDPIIAAVRRSLPGPFALAVDRPPDRVLDLFVSFVFNEATIREIGFLVVKALLTDDQQIVRTVKDALKESNHIFKRDRELALRKKVLPHLARLLGLDIVAIKREIEKLNKKKLEQHQWNRLRDALSLVPLPTGRPKKSGTKRPKSLS